MSSYNLKPYTDLIRSFLDNRISAPDFKQSFLKMFKEDNSTGLQNQFEVLNEVFTDADAFYPNPALRDEGDLDEAQLRSKCELNIAKVRSM